MEIFLKKLISCSIILIVTTISNAQTIVNGTITASKNEKIATASIIVRDSLNKSIISYTYSGDDGKYSLKLDEFGKFYLTFSSLGYQSKTVPIIINNKKELTVNATLQEKSFELDEIIINADRPIVVKKDTATFKTKFFLKGNEVTVEDLLKRIPGLNINSEGTIKVGNKEIEKLMVDGDDLFERGYKILSKNMPAYPIEEVEVLQNYSNNRLLKNIEESDKVALNLKLDEKAKRVWFGNVTLGYGLNNFYEAKGNLMNFGKKNKYYFLTNLNNTGKDAVGDINHLVRPYRFNEPASIGDNQQVYDILYLSSSPPSFKKRRVNFNNAELLSLNAIFNPTEKLKIKTLGFFHWDENDFFRNSLEVVNANGSNFTNTEDFNLRNKTKTGFGKLDVTYNISKSKMLELTTKYSDGDVDGGSNLLFNGTSTVERLATNNQLFDQKINYTNKFKTTRFY